MRHSNLLTRDIAVAMLAAALVTGCASAPPSTLQQVKSRMTSKLTAQCYWEHDGERHVFGAAPVWSACRRWATEVVTVQFAGTAGRYGLRK